MAKCNPEETIVHGYAWLISQPDAGAVIAFSTNSVHRFSLSSQINHRTIKFLLSR